MMIVIASHFPTHSNPPSSWRHQPTTPKSRDGKIRKTLPVICFNWKISLSSSRFESLFCVQTFMTWILPSFILCLHLKRYRASEAWANIFCRLFPGFSWKFIALLVGGLNKLIPLVVLTIKWSSIAWKRPVCVRGGKHKLNLNFKYWLNTWEKRKLISWFLQTPEKRSFFLISHPHASLPFDHEFT